MQEHPIRVKLVELEFALRSRVADTQETAQGFKQFGTRQHMVTVYENRAQGQHDALQMLRSTIELCDSLGLFDKPESDWYCGYCKCTSCTSQHPD